MKRLAMLALVALALTGCSTASTAADYEREPAYTPPPRSVATPTPENARYVLEFSGAGENATVTISTDTGMIQRHVTLPYSEEVPYTPGKTIAANVVKFGSSVGCKITVVSNSHPEGVTLVETPIVDGQTMARCTPPAR
ncbi:hypothetical protein [uncultured Microbacterium sp.]|uniref:hypothetical protein n=1 Tax=uncultured Microbacterium sp. TaxID=191216 RepID=UPI0025FE4EEE|nr:hypothetical protein [uncultured Microbacterium sp.]